MQNQLTGFTHRSPHKAVILRIANDRQIDYYNRVKPRNPKKMKSILFIDDEPFILNSLKRMMRKERNRWKAYFAVGGKEALDILDKRSFDLLVTDMKMPIIDGFQILTECEERYPQMPRIALSGYSEKETQARATTLVHEFLYKPCDSKELKSALETHLKN